MSDLPSKLQEIVEDFSFCVGQEKLEYLLQFAERLPDLPDRLSDRRDQMDEVHECMSPVFIFAEKENGRVIYHFDIPREAPTVRGFATILKEGLDGLAPDQIQAIPNEFYLQMGLQKVLTGQRLNGIGAILAHMKTLAAAD
jgi:cysteine desulfuration protein SufE